ncbi:MAG TPA: hypothetical protein VF223_07505 [Trebonia sp.]|jgi:hypothetical protein
MGSTMLELIVCAPILLGWLLLCGPWYLSRHLARRRRRQELSDWMRMSPGLSDLDVDLDRTWSEDHERTGQERTEQQP